MTPPDPVPIFKAHPAPDGPPTALATLTVTGAAVFTDARCPQCRKIILLVPGVLVLEVRVLPGHGHRALEGASGRGRVALCKNGHYAEVIEHR